MGRSLLLLLNINFELETEIKSSFLGNIDYFVTDFQLPTKEQAFAIGYTTYMSYWATIKLRICAVLFTTNKQKSENQVLCK